MTASIVEPKAAGFFHDLLSVAGRALRSIPREPEVLAPALFIPVFFYFINVGALENVAKASGVSDYRAFQLPVAIIFAVTGLSRASALVLDIQDGYLDRLLMTPIKRATLLLGLMVADFVLVFAVEVPVIGLGYLLGVRFETGVLGIFVFLLMGAFWGASLYRVSVRHCSQDRKPRGGERQFHFVFSVCFYDDLISSRRVALGLVGHGGQTQPSYLSP